MTMPNAPSVPLIDTVELNAEFTVLSTLLREKISFPVNQRSYLWGEKQVTALFNDLLKWFKEKQYESDDITSKFYRLGFIEIRHKLNNGSTHAYIYDGQQRIISCLILLTVIAQKYPKGAINNEIQTFYSGGSSGTPFVDVQNGGKILANYLNDGKIGEAQNRDQEHIIKSIKTFSKLIDNTGFSPYEINHFGALIHNRVGLHKTRTSSRKQASEIFEKSNNRGLQVSPISLIFNKLVDSVDESEEEKLREQRNQADQYLWEASRGSKIKSDLSYLVRYMIEAKSGQKCRENNLVKMFEEHYGYGEAKSFMNEMFLKSQQLASILDNSPVIAALDAKQVLAVKLAACDLPNDMQNYVFEILDARALMYSISQEKQTEYSVLVAKWASEVRRLCNQEDVTRADINNALKHDWSEQFSIFKQKLRTIDFKQKRLKLCVAIAEVSLLDAMNEEKIPVANTNFSVRAMIKPEKGSIHRDHILPKSLPDFDKNYSLGQTLGNIAFLNDIANILKLDTLPEENCLLYSGSPFCTSKVIAPVINEPYLEKFFDKMFNGKPRPHVGDGWNHEKMEQRLDFMIELICSYVSKRLDPIQSKTKFDSTMD